MDFSSILNSFPGSPDATTSYVLLALAAILAYFLLKKVVKIITFVFIFGGMGLALAALSGQDISPYTDPVIAYATQAFATIEGKISEATGGAANTASSGKDDIEKMVSDAMKKR